MTTFAYWKNAAAANPSTAPPEYDSEYICHSNCKKNENIKQPKYSSTDNFVFFKQKKSQETTQVKYWYIPQVGQY